MISLMPTSSSPPPPPRRPTRPLPKMRGPITNSPSGPIGSNLLLPFDLLPKLDCTLKPTITPAGKIAFGTHWFFFGNSTRLRTIRVGYYLQTDNLYVFLLVFVLCLCLLSLVKPHCGQAEGRVRWTSFVTLSQPDQGISF